MGLNRRTFIKYASLAAAGNAAALRPFGALNALAQAPPDYKALVCVFLYRWQRCQQHAGPVRHPGYNNYSTIRGPLAIPQNQLLQLSALPNFALNPNLPDIQTLFDNKNAAFVANVGTLIEPTTKAQYPGRHRPADKSLLASRPATGVAERGAQRRDLDRLGGPHRRRLNGSYNAGASVPMITSVAGDTLFCNGSASTPVSVSPGNLGGAQCSEGTTECGAQLATAQALLSFDSGLTLVQADNSITTNAYSYAKTLSAAVQSVSPLKTVFPTGNALASQLQQIAQIIQVRAALGVSRQIFFCGSATSTPTPISWRYRTRCLPASARRWPHSTPQPWRWACRATSPRSPCRTSAAPSSRTQTPGATTPGDRTIS